MGRKETPYLLYILILRGVQHLKSQMKSKSFSPLPIQYSLWGERRPHAHVFPSRCQSHSRRMVIFPWNEFTSYDGQYILWLRSSQWISFSIVFCTAPVSMCCVRASFPAHSEPNRSILFDVFGGWRTISAHGFWMRSKGISLSRFFSGENSSKGAARLFCDWSFDSLNILGKRETKEILITSGLVNPLLHIKSLPLAVVLQ